VNIKLTHLSDNANSYGLMHIAFTKVKVLGVAHIVIKRSSDSILFMKFLLL